MKDIGNTKIQFNMGRNATQRNLNLYRTLQLTVGIVYLLLGASVLSAQAVTTTECFCLNNQTMPGNGQFQDVVTINSAAGETWEVKTAIGLYSMASPAPPALPTPIPTGTTITETPAGVYTLIGRRIDNTNWKLIVTNGDTTITIHSSLRCKTPGPGLVGDFGACIDSPNKTYTINVPPNLITSITWTVNSGGVIVGPSNQPQVTVNWDGVVGTGMLTATGMAKSYPTQVAGFCNFSLSDEIAIVDEPNVALACDKMLNITLNGSCLLEVTPDLILEEMLFPASSYDIILKDIDADTIIPGNVIGMKYVGKLLQVSVLHECGDNLCWGHILVEDKSIPPLICPTDITVSCEFAENPGQSGLPIPNTAIFWKIGPFKYLVRDFDFCSDVVLEYTDELISANCESEFSSIIRRTWFATDVAGNTFTCTQIVSVVAADAAEITFPDSYDDAIGENPSLESCGDWPKLPNGHPHPDYTGYPMGVLCSNVHIHYDDTRFDICDGDKTFKIRRRWFVSNVCSGETFEGIQTITVMDTTPPELTVPPDFTVNTNETSCASSVKVPIPTVVDCISWDYTVAYKAVDESGDPYTDASVEGIIEFLPNQFLITHLPATSNKYWISYYVFDDCGNTTMGYNTVTIVDKVQPVPICKQYTFVALNVEGWGWAGPEAFDDGSYDNCMIDTILLLRMGYKSCGEINVWSDKVLFCCEDIGDTVMVQMRIFDKAGNYNDCMIEVWVQDNLPPEFTYCPADITVDCGTDLDDLSEFGEAEAYDACGVTITEKVTKYINDCGVGYLIRQFKAQDPYKNMAFCYQRITIKSIHPFNKDSIIWPLDYTILDGCRGDSIPPGDLPEGYRYPKFKYTECAKPGYDYEDIIFQYADGACFKILREWTVIDWCQFDSRLPYQTTWTHTQVIKVLNSTDPVITKGCRPGDLTYTDLDSCRAKIHLMAEGEDDCGPVKKWKYEIDLYNNGSVDVTGYTNTISTIVPYGRHKITWYADDECGNTGVCSYVHDIKDRKDPTPICYSEVVTVVMPTTKMITIWAKDFIKEGLDNCTPPHKLKYSFTTNPKDSFQVFTCDDVLLENGSQILRIYVTDEAGNQDYCETTITVQDNGSVCTGTEVGAKVTISGAVYDSKGRPMGGVKTSITSTEAGFPKSITTTSDGKIKFSDLPQYKNYSLESTYDSPADNGVNTIDIILIQRHILNIVPLKNSYQMIAADVTNDERISASDLVAIRKLILGVTSKFEQAPNWKFVHQLVEGNPYLFIGEAYYPTLTSNITDANFVAVKMGDVDNSFTANASQTSGRSSKVLSYNAVTAQRGEEFTLQFNSDEVRNVAGFQGSFQFDPEKVEFIGAEVGALDLKDDELYVEVDRNGGKINVSHAGIEVVDVQNNWFGLRFRALRNILDDHLLNSRDEINPEIYVESQNGEIEAMDWTLESRTQPGTEFEVFQNMPNPFSVNTSVKFQLPAAGTSTIRVFDLSGRQIYTRTQEFEKGIQEWDVQASDLGISGVLYYQVEYNNQRSGKRMIIIN